MTRILKLPLLACAVAAIAALLVVRSVHATDSREQARQLLAVPEPPAPGNDGTDALWVLSHAVPPADRARVAQARRDYVAERARRMDVGDIAGAEQLVDPLARYPVHPMKIASERLCRSSSAPCLPHVAKDLAGTEAVLREHATLLAAAREMAGFDGVRVDAPWDDTPSPSYGRDVLQTSLALRFLRGEQDAAIEEACRHLAGWRRIGADTGHPRISVGAADLVGTDVRLLAEMLVERPADAPLPAACDAALAPTTDAELSTCRLVRTDFRHLPDALARPTRARFRELADALAFLPPAGTPEAARLEDEMRAAAAPAHAHYCDEAALAAARADKPASSWPAPAIECGKRRVPLTGCDVAWMATDEAAHRVYADRRADQSQKIALLRAMLWLRRQLPDPSTWGDLDIPANLGLRRDGRFQNGLCIPLHEEKGAERFCIAVLSNADEKARTEAEPTTPSPVRR
jgi:hypothetical protein